MYSHNLSSSDRNFPITLLHTCILSHGRTEQGLLGGFCQGLHATFCQGYCRGGGLGFCQREQGVGQRLETLDPQVGYEHEQQAVAG